MDKQQPSVFISYSTKDEAQAISLVDSLESKGYRCWIAKRDLYHSGNDFSLVIPQVIPKCKCVVLLLTENSNNSKHVRNELDIAFEKQVPIFPMRLDETDGKQLEWFLRSSQWFDAIDRTVDELVQAVISKLENTDIHAPVELKKKAWFKKKFSGLYAGIALIVALLLYQTLSPSSQDQNITGGNQGWNTEDMDLSGYDADDFKPQVRYDLKHSNWKILTEAPEGKYLGSIASLKYSLDGKIWQMGYVEGDVQLSNAPTDQSKRLYTKIKDMAGNTLGPFEYEIDFAAIAESRLKTITLEDLNHQVEFRGSQYGWRVSMDPQRFYTHNFWLYYSANGTDWQKTKGSKRIDSNDLGGTDKLLVKFQELNADAESGVIEIPLKSAQTARTAALEAFSKGSHSLRCDHYGCTLRSPLNAIPAISAVEYGLSADQLQFRFDIDIPDDKLADSAYLKTFTQDFAVLLPVCGEQLFYRYKLTDDSHTEVSQTHINRGRPCESDSDMKLYTRAQHITLANIESQRRVVERERDSLDKLQRAREDAMTNIKESEEALKVLQQRSYSALSAKEQRKHNHLVSYIRSLQQNEKNSQNQRYYNETKERLELAQAKLGELEAQL